MGVVVVLTGCPTGKLSALLKAGSAFTNKIGFRQAHLVQGGAHGWPGALANADGFNIWRLDKR